MFDVGNRLMNDLISEFGISKAQAAGVVGNLAHESAGFNTLQEIDPLIEGSRGGFGYAQWTGPRRKQFEEWSASQGLDPSSYEANKGFLVHELKNTPEKRVLDSLKKTKTADQAARVFSDEFLRPGIPHTDSRIELAQKFDGNDDILIGGQGNNTMTAMERARAKLTQEIKPEETLDLIAPEDEKTMSDRLKTAGRFLLDVNDQVAQGIPFIDEAFYGIDTLIRGKEKAREKYLAYNNRLDDFQEDHPIISGAGQVGGALLTGGVVTGAAKVAAPKLAGQLINVAKTAPKTTAILAGAGGTGLYSAAESTEPLAERADDFGIGSMYGGPLGLGGYKLAQGVGRVGNAAVEKYGPVIAPAIERGKIALSPVFKSGKNQIDDVAGMADDLIAPGANQADEVSLTEMAGILDEEDLARLEGGRTVPLTKGDRTQDVKIQRREQIAAEAGSEPILKARAEQQAAARKPFVKALGDEAENAQDIDLRMMEQMEAENAANIVRKNYDSLKARENAAWTKARESGEGVGLRANAVQEDFLNPVRQVLKDREYRPGDVPQLDKHLGELESIFEQKNVNSNNVALKIKAMEKWKTRLNNLSFSSETLSPKSAMALKTKIGRQYDTFMTEVRDEAIVNGDDTAIKAFKEARNLSRERFGMEQSDKVVGKILQSRDLQGEQLVNVMMGTEKLLAKGDDGRVLITMLDQAGDRAPEMRAAMKRGIMAKTFRRGLTKNTTEASNPDQAAVSFSKMRTEIGNMMQKKEVFETLFDPTEQQYMRQFYDNLQFLASKQKGAINNSSTGVWTAEFAKGFGKLFNNPLMRSNPVTGIAGNFGQERAERYAAQQITGKAEQGLSEFIEKQINQIDAPAAFYGPLGASSVGPDGIVDILGVEFEGEDE